jgi:hypothetical protein
VTTFCTKHALLAMAHIVLFAAVTQTSGLVFGSVLKLLAIATFAFLLSFVIGRSPNLLKLIGSCLNAAPVLLSTPDFKIHWPRITSSAALLPDEPLLAARFQRPPPLFSL